jgi:hypothetical protein
MLVHQKMCWGEELLCDAFDRFTPITTTRDESSKGAFGGGFEVGHGEARGVNYRFAGG